MTITSAHYRRLSLILFAGLLITIVTTFRQYGITWDEDWQNQYGHKVVAFYRSGFKDRAALEFHDLYLYGGLFDAGAAIVNKVSPLGEFETRHLLNALVGLLGIVAAWTIGRELGGERLGFWASLALTLNPEFYGHMFNNPKDIPFAVGYLWSLYFLIRCVRALPRIPWYLVIGTGVSMGLTLGVRVGGLLLFGYAGLVFGWYVVTHLTRHHRHDLLRALLDLTVRMVSICAIAYLLMISTWPYAATDPLHHPLQAAHGISQFRWGGSALFAGQFYPGGAVPPSYIPVYLFIKNPELLWGLLAAGLWLFAANVVKEPQRHLQNISCEAFGTYGLLIFAVMFPVLYAIVTHATVYDEVRHFIFVVPILTILAALSFVKMCDCFRTKRRQWRYAASAITVGYVLFLNATMVRLHPYENVYYNGFVGGLRGASTRYETDYWGAAFRAAALELLARVQEEHRGWPLPEIKLQTCGSTLSTTYYLPNNFRLITPGETPDFFITHTRLSCDRSIDAPVLFSVDRLGVPLAIVKDVRHKS